MYTFGILALFFLILSGIIFKGKIKQNQFVVALIIFTGTLIGSIIVNGVVGLDTEYTLESQRTKVLDIYTSKVIDNRDTLFCDDSYINYNYELEIDEDGDTTLSRYLKFGFLDNFYKSETVRKNKMGGRAVKVEFLPDGDSIPYFEVLKYKRINTNKWVSGFGLPRGGRDFIVYIPNDSIHQVLMNFMNENFFDNET
ncbi:MAG: hypothetical protein ACTSW3_03660, partial [Promethearchaeota archaeon]